MTQIDRRRLLALAAASLALPPAIERAWAIDARVTTGTIEDVQHVVILMQENRSFDHYFGTMNGVRGFGDRFPIPLPGGRTVWTQENGKAGPKLIAPFALNTQRTFAHMRVEGTPHSWPDAQYAWDAGRMSQWPTHKGPHTMAHYVEADIPFQFALANAFTLCEAYHCSFQGGTNTNRLFLWTGMNEAAGHLGGPSISNSHDTLPKSGAVIPPYLWTTYPERLEAAGISWKIYEDMADNFGDNPLVGFKSFRDSYYELPDSNLLLADKGLTTQHLDELRADVMAEKLPQVSWVISPAKDSEHPGPSSPAQGADYTARVLDCLTSNPEVWARTVFLVMFDENDGFFDHVPPPAPPIRDAAGKMWGGSTVDCSHDYHMVRNPTEAGAERDDLMGRPYGLGPRVPLYVISPWSRGGWVNGEVFDHTSILRFLETRFGVKETNISPWRRAVCGDLTSCFDFKTPNKDVAKLPETAVTAQRAATLPGRTKPPTPEAVSAPVQAVGVRRSRALPYALAADMPGPDTRIVFRNTGTVGAVFHVYDRLRLEEPPRRYTVEAGKELQDEWPSGPYDLQVIGPNGFYRRFAGQGAPHELIVQASPAGRQVRFQIRNPGSAPLPVNRPISPYSKAKKASESTIRPGGPVTVALDVAGSGGWYDQMFSSKGLPGWLRHYAGRIDNGQPTYSDPAMGGAAIMIRD